MHGFLDHDILAAKPERRAPERRNQLQPFQSGFFIAFADRRLAQFFTRFGVALRKRPAAKRVFDEENLNDAAASAEDDSSARDLLAEGLRLISLRRFASRKPLLGPVISR